MIAPFFLLSPLCLPACLTCQVPAETTPRSAPDRRHRPKATSISKKNKQTPVKALFSNAARRGKPPCATMSQGLKPPQGRGSQGQAPRCHKCHRASLQVIYMQGADSSGRSGTKHRPIRKVRHMRHFIVYD